MDILPTKLSHFVMPTVVSPTCAVENHPITTLLHFVMTPQLSQKRSDVAQKFQRVFSRLPTDIQIYIAEFVPSIFLATKLSGKIILDHRVFHSPNHRLFSKKEWMLIYNELRKTPFVKNIHRSSKPEEYCEKIKQLYKSIYSQHYEYVIHNADFGYRKKPKGTHTILMHSGVLQNIKQIHWLKE